MRRARAGFTLIELVIAIVITSMVLAAVLGVAVRQRSFYTRTADVAGASDALELAELAIEPEILPVSPGAGDLLHMGADSLALRLWRGVFAVCEIDLTASGHAITLRRVSASGEPAAGDSALIYSQGTDPGIGDDSWLPVAVSSATDATCADGTASRSIEVTGLSPSDAASIASGSPVRPYRQGAYWIASRSDGWFLMTDARGGSARALNTPFAPAGTDSLALRFRYLDADGADAASVASIVRIDVEVTARGAVARRDGGHFTKSRVLSLKLRNN